MYGSMESGPWPGLLSMEAATNAGRSEPSMPVQSDTRHSETPARNRSLWVSSQEVR